jgi:steroid delta-isomerase-like uncharacterized protein
VKKHLSRKVPFPSLHPFATLRYRTSDAASWGVPGTSRGGKVGKGIMMGRLRALTVGLAVLTLLCGRCPAGAADSTGANKDIILQFYDLFNAGDGNGLAGLVVADVVHHNLPPGLPPGLDGVRQEIVAYHAAFPDVEVTVVDTAAEGDRVAARVFVTGTQKGAFSGVPVSNRAVAFETMAIYRLAGGKIAEIWEVGDVLTAMIQIGAIPSPGAPPHVLPSTAPKGTGDLAANKAIAQRFYDLFNVGNLDGLGQVVDANVVDHEPGPGQASGVAGLKQSLGASRSAFPDLHVTVADVLAEGDKVVVRRVAKGTQTGTFFGAPPSGAPVVIDAIDIARIANGKIVELWHVENIVAVLAQIGAGPLANAIPPSSPAAPSAPQSAPVPSASVAAPSSPATSPAPFSPDPNASGPILATGPRFTGPGYAAGHLSP